MQQRTISPHLWFDREAKQAAEFYASVFPDSQVTHVTTLHGTPGGDTDVVSFTLGGLPFNAISAGPLFKFNPSTSFMVNFDPSRDADARQHLDEAWQKLSDGGTALMPLDEYPFSKRYGWIQDRFGLSWQLILTDPAGEPRPLILPTLMFTGAVAGRAEEAINFYASVFEDSKRGALHRYGPGQEPNREGSVMFADFMLAGTWFAAMDSAVEHGFSFNEAVSFMVPCDTQAEIDRYWQKLSAVPEAEQCGWLKDRFGLSWQVTSSRMQEMLTAGSREQIDRVTQAFLPMKKLDLAELERAYAGA